MAKTAKELSFKQVQEAVDRLGRREKQQLLRRLEREERRTDWDPLVRRLRAAFAKNPMTDEEIRETCEEIRQEIYEEKRRKKNKRRR